MSTNENDEKKRYVIYHLPKTHMEFWMYLEDFEALHTGMMFAFFGTPSRFPIRNQVPPEGAWGYKVQAGTKPPFSKCMRVQYSEEPVSHPLPTL